MRGVLPSERFRFLLLIDGPRSTPLGPGPGDSDFGLGPIDLQTAADIAPDGHVSNVDGDNFECCLRTKARLKDTPGGQ